MDTYASISLELKKFFSQNGFFKILLPLDCVLYLGARIYSFLQLVPIVTDFFFMASPFSDVIYYIGYIGLFLVYANRKDQILAVGFFIKTVTNLGWFLLFLIKYGDFMYSNLLDVVVYALIGFLILKRSYQNDTVLEG